MVIGSIKIMITIEESVSLKDKRKVIKSIKDRIRHRFNVAIAEIDFQDYKQDSLVGVVTLANDEKFVQSLLDQVISFIERYFPGRITDYDTLIEHV